MREYDYSASTFDADAHICELNREISDYCQGQPLRTDADRSLLLHRLLQRVSEIAAFSVSRLEGGPFAAILVDFAPAVPVVVGFGTNHVVPASDPSAHAEITAIRDACARLGRTDLSGITLIASCECCPMCLSAATGCKLEKIYCAATRADAARAGFSDDNQYQLMASGGIERHGVNAQDDATRGLLAGHDALVQVTHEGRTDSYYGDGANGNAPDPTDLPLVQAIRKACKMQACFHLPQDTLIISRFMPHPLSLMVADWARIGRVRGGDPLDPAQDRAQKDVNRMLYIEPIPEPMPVYNVAGLQSHVAHEDIWAEIRRPSCIHIEGIQGRSSAFDAWIALVSHNHMPRY